MTNTVKLKRSAAPGAAPSTGQLDLGEVAINTNDGKMYIKKDNGTESIVQIGDTSQLAYKEPVRGATTANITLSGNVVMDGLTTAAGDRILVKNQSTASENGIYVASAGAWSRAADFDTNADVRNGVLVPVQFGTTNGGTLWQLTTGAASISLGSTSLGFTQVGAGGGGGGATHAVGTILQAPSAPTGDGTWLACNGSMVSQSTYSSLFSAVGHKFFIPQAEQNTRTNMSNGTQSIRVIGSYLISPTNFLQNTGYSSDGLTWTVPYTSFVSSNNTRSSAVVNGYWIGCSAGAEYMISAQNDPTLLYVTSQTGWAGECYDIAYSSSLNRYVAVGNSTFGAKYTSDPFGSVSVAPSGSTYGQVTGVTWTAGSGLAVNTRQIIWTGTNFVTINSSGSIRYSSSGTAFSTAAMPTNAPAVDGGIIWYDSSVSKVYALIPASSGSAAYVQIESTDHGQTWVNSNKGMFVSVAASSTFLHRSGDKTVKTSTGLTIITSSSVYALYYSNDDLRTVNIVPCFGNISWSNQERGTWVEFGDYLFFNSTGGNGVRVKFKDSVDFQLPDRPGHYIKASA